MRRLGKPGETCVPLTDRLRPSLQRTTMHGPHGAASLSIPSPSPLRGSRASPNDRTPARGIQSPVRRRNVTRDPDLWTPVMGIFPLQKNIQRVQPLDRSTGFDFSLRKAELGSLCFSAPPGSAYSPLETRGQTGSSLGSWSPILVDRRRSSSSLTR